MPDDPLLAADPGAQGENDVRRQYTRSLHILMGLVGLVLIAACANVANLLVARGNARRREIALRLALGARPRRIVRQLLAESLLLAIAGAGAGFLVAWWSRGVLLALRPFGNTTVVLDLPLDGRVLGFTLVSALATALVFGLAPALRATRVDLTAEFQGGARALASGGRSRLSQTLMVVQVALSLVLLVSTGLFVRTVSRLQEVDAGFNRRNLALFRIDATSAGYTREQFAALHARIQERLEAIPGVQAATFSRVALLSRTRQNMTFSVPGHAPPPGTPTVVNTNGLASNFFAAMELPLILGRGFTERDGPDAPKVAVVNQVFARTYFGEEPAARPAARLQRAQLQPPGRDCRHRARREVHRSARGRAADGVLPRAPAAGRQREFRAAHLERPGRDVCRDPHGGAGDRSGAAGAHAPHADGADRTAAWPGAALRAALRLLWTHGARAGRHRALRAHVVCRVAPRQRNRTADGIGGAAGTDAADGVARIAAARLSGHGARVSARRMRRAGSWQPCCSACRTRTRSPTAASRCC